MTDCYAITVDKMIEIKNNGKHNCKVCPFNGDSDSLFAAAKIQTLHVKVWFTRTASRLAAQSGSNVIIPVRA